MGKSVLYREARGGRLWFYDHAAAGSIVFAGGADSARWRLPEQLLCEPGKEAGAKPLGVAGANCSVRRIHFCLRGAADSTRSAKPPSGVEPETYHLRSDCSAN